MNNTKATKAGERTQKTAADYRKEGHYMAAEFMERYEKEERTHNATNGSHHTPGPWNNRGGSGLSIQDARGQELAEVKNVGIDGKPNPSHANARLIAAAPELLAIVKVLARWTDGGQDSINFGALVGREDHETLAFLVRTAIAKAEGRAQ